MNPFEQGTRAFLKGVKIKNGTPIAITNPFKVGTEKYRSWEYGYNKAYFQNMRELEKTNETS